MTATRVEQAVPAMDAVKSTRDALIAIIECHIVIRAGDTKESERDGAVGGS